MRLLNVAKLIPDGSTVIARRQSWAHPICVEMCKHSNGTIEARNIITGDKVHITPESACADDWEFVH